ncbi:signal peptidase I [Croceicoccus sp. F390]|uniref:Signal peptidase I n=1 Tax=Croceicoccus esteveae TaxID=3075597 RepID=A0ABU2ZF79_9SPHN|nr:signal peptidase I [Croceicoccus sp. F390]MDT0575258.1 signal peptidase I [Croceicoccus sp. F390]
MTGITATGPDPLVSPASGSGDEAGRGWFGELATLVAMLLAVLTFHSLVAKPFYIPSISMMPNLLVGDRLIVSKYPYGWSWVSASFHVLPRSDHRIMPGMPEYGDIVIVSPPHAEEDWIKRVVALPGDRIAVRNGQIVLNGKAVRQEVEPAIRLATDDAQSCDGMPCFSAFESFRVRTPSGKWEYELPSLRETLPNGASYLIIDHREQPLDNQAEITVPAGHLFLMGDNRDHSADSREQRFGIGLGGPVPLADIGGRAEFVTFSLDGSEQWNPMTWWPALRSGRALANLRPPLRQSPQPQPAAEPLLQNPAHESDNHGI